jgi:hypothetical protein
MLSFRDYNADSASKLPSAFFGAASFRAPGWYATSAGPSPAGGEGELLLAML